MRPLYHEMFINQGSVHHKMYQAKDKDFVESAQSSLLVVSVDLFLVWEVGKEWQSLEPVNYRVVTLDR